MIAGSTRSARRRRTTAGHLFGLSLLVVVCTVARPAIAQAQDDEFRRGLQARGDKKWQEVVTHMRAAIQRDGQESNRKTRSGFLGMQGMEYLPHYFLGEALFNLENCAGAVEAWAISEQQAVVRVRSEFVEGIRDGYRACAAKGVLPPGEYSPLLTSTRQAYVDATALGKRVSDLGAAHKELWRPDVSEQFERARRELEAAQNRLSAATRGRSASDFAEARAASERAVALLRPLEATLSVAVDTLTVVPVEVEQLIQGADVADRAVDSTKISLPPALAASRKRGRDQLGLARERLAAAQRAQSPSTVNEALEYAQSASTILSQVLDEVRKLVPQQLADAIKSADEAFAFVESSFATLERRANEQPESVRPEMNAERDALKKQVDALRRRLERARRAEDLAAVLETTRQTSEARIGLDALIKSLGPASLRDRGVHAALEEGARLFFNGEYQKALAALEPGSGVGEAPLQLHAHLFRAAALYALFVRSGETDQALRARAQSEVESCKQLDPAFQPSPRAFAPRFISFFQNPGVPGTQGAPTAN